MLKIWEVMGLVGITSLYYKNESFQIWKFLSGKILLGKYTAESFSTRERLVLIK